MVALLTYKTPTAYLKINAIHTNTGSTNPYRGSNRPDVAYYIERLIDVAAAEINIDRMELRRRNIIPDDAFPIRVLSASIMTAVTSPSTLKKRFA